MNSYSSALFLMMIFISQQVASRPVGSPRCLESLTSEENKSKAKRDAPTVCGGGGGGGLLEAKTPLPAGDAGPPPAIFQRGRGLGAPVLTEEQREERKRQVFEGLLHFATVVNHIDSFMMDKGKLFLKSLGKMVASEEDPRFEM